MPIRITHKCQIQFSFWLLSQCDFCEHPEPLPWATLSLDHISIIPYLLSTEPMWFNSLRSVQCHLNKKLIHFGDNKKRYNIEETFMRDFQYTSSATNSQADLIFIVFTYQSIVDYFVLLTLIITLTLSCT